MDWWIWGLRYAGLWWLMIFHRSYAVVGEDADTVFFRCGLWPVQNYQVV
jgi:hypothetical protein